MREEKEQLAVIEWRKGQRGFGDIACHGLTETYVKELFPCE